MKGCYIAPVTRRACAPFIMSRHYAKRFPPLTHAFGLFAADHELIGVATFGTPLSDTLRRGICGDEYAPHVLELNRVSLKYNRKNEASRLVSGAIKMLGGDKIIVSYSDTDQGHVGTIYQACNFIYCGLSADRKEWTVKGREGLHSSSIGDEFRGVEGRTEALKEKYGDQLYLRQRSRKHRYIMFNGTKGFVAKMNRALRYERKPYPKGEQP